SFMCKLCCTNHFEMLLHYVNAVTQSPNFMLAAKENATLNCNHTKGDTYNRMYWFRQHQGKTMELIVFTTSFGTVEFGKLEKTKYSVKHESAAKGVLTVISLESDDNALYLCAVSEHSEAESFHRCTKTHLFNLTFSQQVNMIRTVLSVFFFLICLSGRKYLTIHILHIFLQSHGFSQYLINS
uniref:Ig-like domain-containing protein n=1 Tax=Cyprinus carpio TaxID=7962 RepID=A0A8C2C715_CYPCA